MLKLEEDYTYNELQKRLATMRNNRKMIEAGIKHTLNHINAIKSDFKTYEEECNAENSKMVE